MLLDGGAQRFLTGDSRMAGGSGARGGAGFAATEPQMVGHVQEEERSERGIEEGNWEEG